MEHATETAQTNQVAQNVGADGAGETYLSLKAKAEEMMRRAEEIRRAEIRTVIAEIRARMTQYGITLADLGEGAQGKKRAAKSKAEPKYRGPNGELWSGGFGRKPEWVRKVIAEGGDIEQYRIRTE